MTEVTSKPKGFQGLRVVSFESRRSDQMADLIQRNGGEAIVAPSMREIPLEENKEALAFGQRLLQGEFDMVVFLTGVGARALFEILKTQYSQEDLVKALSKITLAARGPKSVAALADIGLKTQVQAPEPNTWRELLTAIDQYYTNPSPSPSPPGRGNKGEGLLKGKTVAVQEYGVPSKALVEGLVERGALVVRIPVYRWALPEDTAPLRKALQSIVQGKTDVVLFTNANQISNVLRLAQEEGLEQEFRKALSRTVVASVGPVCTEFLDEYGVPVDIEPEHPKMGNLVLEASRKSRTLLEKKRELKKKVLDLRIDRSGVSESRRMGVAPSHRSADALFQQLHQSPVLKACRMEETPYTPIWLMRQAGRYMKEYRTLRERHGFLELCKDSDLACEVSVYAVERLGVDAAIIFSDILVLLEPMRLKLEYAKGDGPIVRNPIRSVSDLARLRPLTDVDPLSFVMDAIRKTRRTLPSQIPLIGFAGAPFTLASYMVEGQGSRNYIHTKTLMYTDPTAWHKLMRIISDSLVHYLNGQIAAGAQAVQLFDSWVGCLSPQDYRQFVLPHTKYVIDHIGYLPLTRSPSPPPSPPRRLRGEGGRRPGEGIKGGGVPVIHFGTGTGALLELMKDAGGDVIGLDWRVDLDKAWGRLGQIAVQGNLDPVALFAEIPEIRRQAKHILDQAGGRPGHIFNLGHGILPETPVGHVKALVDAVHEFGVRVQSPRSKVQSSGGSRRI